MKSEADIASLLISNAINLIAEGGFEKATTKELTYYKGNSPNAKMNEVYIYRLFGGKKGLYEATFAYLDKELYEAFQGAVKAIGNFGRDTKKKLYEFFLMAWNFVLNNEERFRCYVRYYYSIYFKGESLEKHNRLFEAIMNSFSSLFIEEADVKSIMHSVFTALLDFAIRVYNGDLENNESNVPHIFNVLYCMMMTYLKSPETSGGNTQLI
ncbi:MAG: TetR/AcrR family transcriptional regulator [Clostridia bacterium]|nr:TetR/AcrR family transcriptional regulator [Clostridia bacterium]